MTDIKVVVDSGSTKADWLIFKDGKYIYTFKTKGLNPEVVSYEELIERLKEAKKQIDNQNAEDKAFNLHFFGAGCGTTRSKTLLENPLLDVFDKEKLLTVEIKEDTYAAAYATCQKLQKGIVCINGTGSNCSYFDGEKLHQAIDSLGYLAMDDFSGVSFGRQLIRAYFFKSLPSDLANKLDSVHDMNSDEIKKNFYNKENPNAYLASFLPFIIEHKEHPFFQQMIKKECEFFVENYIMQFSECKEILVHFIGSTAFLLQNTVKKVLKSYKIQAGFFYQKPLDGLIKHFSY